jgi:hypothetical protein
MKYRFMVSPYYHRTKISRAMLSILIASCFRSKSGSTLRMPDFWRSTGVVVVDKESLPENVIEVIRDVIEKLGGLIDDAVKPAKKPAVRKPKHSSEHIKKGIDVFTRLHHEKFGNFPYLTLPDKMALGNLVRDLPDFEAIVKSYLESSDAWVAKNGYAPRFIPGQVEALRKLTSIPQRPEREWK